MAAKIPGGQPEESGGQRPAETSRALGGEVQREPQPEESVERSHDEEIHHAHGLSLRVRGEKPQPDPGKHRGEEPDGGGHPGRDARSRPRHPLRARYLSRADIGAHHGHERRAHAEDQGDLQILEPRAHAVAGEGGGAERADQSRDEHHGEIGQDGVEGAGGAHAQDLPEELTTDLQPFEGKPHRAPRRGEVADQHEAGQSEAHEVRRRGAGHSKAGKRAPSHDERGSQAQVEQGGAGGDGGGQDHGARAAHHARERVQQPEDDGATEHDVRVGEGGLEGRTPAAHGPVQHGPAEEEGEGEEGGHGEGDEHGVRGEGLGLTRAPGSEGARDGGGHPAAHPARRHGLHEHDERIHERHSGERVCSEPSHEHRVHGRHHRLEHHDQDIGGGEPEEGGGHRRFEEATGARVHG